MQLGLELILEEESTQESSIATFAIQESDLVKVVSTFQRLSLQTLKQYIIFTLLPKT